MLCSSVRPLVVAASPMVRCSTAAGAVGALALLATYRRYSRRLRAVDRTHVVLVTGCDSGLGFNMALRCHQLNMFVVAACLDTASPGAVELRSLLDPLASCIVPLDVRSDASIETLRARLAELLGATDDDDGGRPQGRRLAAVVNNAGVMCFGEFEWQTAAQWRQQLQVNALGTMAVTHALLPLCRAHGARVLVVTSHCAVASLPGLAPYAASKAALRHFCDALRVEQRKYGVDVVDFVPGSFVMASDIAATLRQQRGEQRAALAPEQWRAFGGYFQRYHRHLEQLGGGGARRTQRFADANGERMLATFERALLERRPRALYWVEPTWRYAVYHWLFRWTPTGWRDWLVQRFVCLPAFAAGPGDEEEERRFDGVK